MSKFKGAIVIDTARCKGCCLCVEACPHNVIELGGHVNMRGYNYVQTVDESGCVGCAACAIVCPDACIEVYRKKGETE